MSILGRKGASGPKNPEGSQPNELGLSFGKVGGCEQRQGVSRRLRGVLPGLQGADIKNTATMSMGERLIDAAGLPSGQQCRESSPHQPDQGPLEQINPPGAGPEPHEVVLNLLDLPCHEGLGDCLGTPPPHRDQTRVEPHLDQAPP